MVDYNENVYGRRGLDGRDHIPALPFWVALIRIAQFVLALIVLILIAYASSVFTAGFVAGYGMAFFTFAYTVLFLLYIFITPLWYPQAYLYWAHLGFETSLTIFWLSTWALLAQEASELNSLLQAENALNQLFSDPAAGFTIDFIPTSFEHAISATKAAAGIGALTWLLFVISLIVFGNFLHKHRVAHGARGFVFGSSTAAPADVESAAQPAAPTTTEEKYRYQASAEPAMEMNEVQHPQPQVSLPAAA